MKTAIIILSDPKGGDESLGRLFNGLATAHEAMQAGDRVEIVFNGAGTRWPGELVKLSHPVNKLYNLVRNSVRGASCGCSEVFGATDSAKACGVSLVKDSAIPGTPGLLNLRRYLVEGWQTMVF